MFNNRAVNKLAPYVVLAPIVLPNITACTSETLKIGSNDETNNKPKQVLVENQCVDTPESRTYERKSSLHTSDIQNKLFDLNKEQFKKALQLLRKNMSQLEKLRPDIELKPLKVTDVLRGNTIFTVEPSTNQESLIFSFDLNRADIDELKVEVDANTAQIINLDIMSQCPIEDNDLHSITTEIQREVSESAKYLKTINMNVIGAFRKKTSSELNENIARLDVSNSWNKNFKLNLDDRDYNLQLTKKPYGTDFLLNIKITSGSDYSKEFVFNDSPQNKHGWQLFYDHKDTVEDLNILNELMKKAG
ncbi:MAG: hypothetical protein HRT47_04425 [Candidatus Caenarcaniphilales bacterium]|nr:hypothetical protein [Candidatus Caenarcaniphilales bacterium]